MSNKNVSAKFKFCSGKMAENNKFGEVNEGVVSKETVVLRWWGSSIQKFGFINGVDNVNWPPYRESLYGGQFTLSTPLIKPKVWRSVSLGDHLHHQILVTELG